MTETKTRALTVISAGLTQPSSSRLLADRLTAATVDALTAAASTPTSRSSSCATTHTRSSTICSPDFRRRPAIGRRSGRGVRRPHRRHTDLQRVLQRPVQVVLRRSRAGTLDGMSTLIGATGGTARHSLALEHAIRPMFAYLRAGVVPTAVYAASEDWAGSGDQALAGGLHERVTSLRQRWHRVSGPRRQIPSPTRCRSRSCWRGSALTDSPVRCPQQGRQGRESRAGIGLGIAAEHVAAQCVGLTFGGGVAPVERTPSVLVHREPHRDLHRYGVRSVGAPVLLVPPLAVPMHCYDLRPGQSLVAHLAQTAVRRTSSTTEPSAMPTGISASRTGSTTSSRPRCGA